MPITGLKRFSWILLTLAFLAFFVTNILNPRMTPDVERKVFYKNPDLVTVGKMCDPGEFLYWSDEGQGWGCSTDKSWQ